MKETLDSPAVAKVENYQFTYQEQRLPGTCDWIQKDSLYRNWVNQSQSVLWILGGPGVGKSCLSSSIVSHLQQLYPQDPDLRSETSVAYFYIKEDEHQLQSASTVLRTWAHQIASHNTAYHKFISYNVCRFSHKLSTEKKLWNHLFLDFFGSSTYPDQSVFLILDGVDEAPKESLETLLRFVADLENPAQPLKKPRIQIAVVGRPEIIHFDELDKSRPCIAMSSETNTEDIRCFAKQSLKRIEILTNRRLMASQSGKAMQNRLKVKIYHKLMEHANGMFLVSKIGGLALSHLICVCY